MLPRHLLPEASAHNLFHDCIAVALNLDQEADSLRNYCALYVWACDGLQLVFRLLFGPHLRVKGSGCEIMVTDVGLRTCAKL